MRVVHAAQYTAERSDPGQPDRIDRTRRWLAQMTREIDAWIETRRRKDILDQYHAHLTVLGATLAQTLDRVRQTLDTVPRNGDTGTVYRACRALDGNLVLVHRLWRYFADKLEQRDGAEGALLRGADEVVWSLYAPVVRNAQLAAPSVAFLGPPLPHVEPLFSPRVIPRSEPPRDLRPQDRLFAGLLARLPIPVVSLPPWCVSQPWWLIYLAHEVGHHVQYDLLPDAALIHACQERLIAALQPQLGAGAFDPALQRWLAWNPEMFADVYAALTAGPAAVWALAEIVWGDATDMLAEHAVYPSPALRLALGHAVCARQTPHHPIDDAPALPTIHGRTVPAWLDTWSGDTGPRARLAADLTRIDIVAHALCELPIGSATLASVCALAYETPFAASGLVARLAAGLCGQAPLVPETVAGANAARLLTSAAVLAYRDLGAIPDQGARAEAEARLRTTYLDALHRSREPGTRNSETPSQAECARRGIALGDALVDALQAAPEGEP